MNVEKFITFLKQSGAEILEPTNDYEVVRFSTMNGVSVVYQRKNGHITFTGESYEARKKFDEGSIWQIERKNKKKLRLIKAFILKRDGPNCFFCGKETTDGEDRTIEHILSIAHGGNNHDCNLTIACESCNTEVGNLPVVEKIKYRDGKLGIKS